MRQNNSNTTVLAWELTSRLLVVGLLFLSGFQFLAAAVVYRELGENEADKLIFAGSLLFAGVAFALGLGFWRSGAPTWKHKAVVAIMVLPAAVSLALR